MKILMRQRGCEKYMNFLLLREIWICIHGSPWGLVLHIENIGTISFMGLHTMYLLARAWRGAISWFRP